jgi:hypothetical protein
VAGIKVALIPDVKPFIKGVEDAERALDDVADALDDVAKEAKDSGGDAGKDLARGIDKGTDTATDSVEKLERSFRDMAQAAAKSGKAAGDDLGSGVRKGTDDASAGVDELGSEAASTARETAASFDGSAESIAGAFQEVAANAFAGFGPAGALAGLAVAAGLGIITTTLQTAADEANALTEEAGAFALSLRDSDAAGRVELLRDRFDEVATKIADARSIWEVWQPRAVTNIERFAQAAREGGFDIEGLFDAFDNPDPIKRLADLNRVFADTRTRLKEVTAEIDASLEAETALTDPRMARAQEVKTEALKATRDALNDSTAAMEEEIKTSEAAADITTALAAAHHQTTEEYAAAQAAIEQQTEVQDAYQSALESSGDAVSVYEGILSSKTDDMRRAAQEHADSTKETTGQAADSWEDYATDVTVTTEDLIAEWNRQAEEAAAFEANLAIIGANGGQALADELRAKGPEVGAATAAAIAQSDPAVQAQAIDAHAAATGTAMVGAMASGISGGQSAVQGAVDGVAAGLTSPSIPVYLLPDATALERELLKPRMVNVQVATRAGVPIGI